MHGQAFGEWVRSRRATLLLTQEDLSAHTGVSVRTIQNLESGSIATPRPATRRQLLAVLGPRDEAAPRPAQLPRDAAWFTGREAELDELLAMVADPGAASEVVLGAIDGMAGVGKTALAVRAGHRLSGRYPDGQLFVELHGFAEAAGPLRAAEVLDRLMRSMGVPGERIPIDMDDRAALWRSVLAGRRVLILLDDAAGVEQVSPLLPGTPGCLVLVTSRRQLVGLDATRTVSLDILPVRDAVALFASSAGRDGSAGDAGLVVEAAELCGRLPLALRLAAARLRHHPSWGVGDLVARLRDQAERLRTLGDGPRSVTAALRLSYQQLTTAQQRMYRALGAHPGYDFEPHAAGALAGITPDSAARRLEELLAAHLLQETCPGRYVFHDLVRVHASGTAADHEPERRAALRRLLDHYGNAAAVAMRAAYPYEVPDRLPIPTESTVDSFDPVGWLDAELPNLLASAARAAEDGWPAHTMRLSAVLDYHLRVRNHHRDAEAVHDQALTAARAAGDVEQELLALTRLGWVRQRQSNGELAIHHYGQALVLARATGHGNGELLALVGLGDAYQLACQYEPAIDSYRQVVAHTRIADRPGCEIDALNGLGNVHQIRGWYEQATDHFGRALAKARTTGHRTGELYALIGLSGVHVIRGRYGQATERYREALELSRAMGHRSGEMNALSGLGRIHRREGHYRQATEHFGQVLEIARTTGHRPGELGALIGLANVERLREQYVPAADYCRRARTLAKDIDDRNWQFEALHVLARIDLATSQPERALAHHREALELAIALDQPADQARAHDGLAHAHRALGRRERACHHWQRALEILGTLGTEHTDEPEVTVPAIRGHLSRMLDGGQGRGSW